jgi:hypothetical protein
MQIGTISVRMGKRRGPIERASEDQAKIKSGKVCRRDPPGRHDVTTTSVLSGISRAPENRLLYLCAG